MKMSSNKIMEKTCFGIIFVLHVSLCVFMCALCPGNYWELRFMSVRVCIYFFLAVYMYEYHVFHCDHVSLQHRPTPRRSQCQSTIGSINRKKRDVFIFIWTLFACYSSTKPLQACTAFRSTQNKSGVKWENSDCKGIFHPFEMSPEPPPT